MNYPWLFLGLVILVLWAGGVVRFAPINLFTEEGQPTWGKRRHWIRTRGRLWGTYYWLWTPVREVIPFLLYVRTPAKPFYLDDYGFKSGAR
jgi:hypothetical protein